MSIFKACDIRGVAGEELTTSLYRRLGRGLGVMMGELKTIGVGGDFRLSTPEFKAELIAGLCAVGCKVTDLGQAPTPVIYFGMRHLGLDACAIVTASHNPPDHNGLKFMIDGWPPLPGDLMQLRIMVEMDGDRTAASESGAVTFCDVTGPYATWVAQAACNLAPPISAEPRRMAVVVDAGNGAYSAIAPRVLSGLAEVSVAQLFCTADGRFPGRGPDCTSGCLKALCQEVCRIGADLGIAFDGDGDRAAFVDETGRVLEAEEAAVIFMRSMASQVKHRGFVYDLKCSRIVAREALKLGATPLMERSGHGFIKQRMIREDAFFGAEISGHYFYADLHGGDDGLLSVILMARILQAAERPLSLWSSDLPRRFMTPDVRIELASHDMPRLLDAIRRTFPASMRNELDGIRVEFPNGWGLIRSSITEPKITLRFEGESGADLDEVIAAFLAPLPELKQEVFAALRRSAGDGQNADA